MKNVLFVAAALLVSFTAQAEVKQFGSFVPSLCSREKSDNPTSLALVVESACVGKIVGGGSAIQLQLNNGTSQMFAVEMQGGLRGMGAGTATFEGESRDGSGETISGKLHQTSGMTTTNDIQLSTSQGLEYSGALEFVFTTM